MNKQLIIRELESVILLLKADCRVDVDYMDINRHGVSIRVGVDTWERTIIKYSYKPKRRKKC